MIRINHISLISLYFLFILFNTSINAQFINLQIKVEPELSIEVDQSLNFGNIVSNSGQQFINLGDVNMGVFNIKAIYTQSMFIELNTPEALLSDNPDVDDEIPIDLSVAFNNTGINDASNSILLANNQGYISVYNESTGSQPSNIWQHLYLYVYGSIYVGDIPNGDYSGEILLQIDYQ